MATPRSRHRRSIGLVAAALALGLVAACGGGGGSAAPGEPLQFFLSGAVIGVREWLVAHRLRTRR